MHYVNKTIRDYYLHRIHNTIRANMIRANIIRANVKLANIRTTLREY